MIVRPLDDQLLVTTQSDHAALAAEILGLWREDALPTHPRRRELLFAVREHDNGWREADSAPRRSPDGRPCGFLEVPDAVRRELWDRGVRRWTGSEPWASRLILRHALELHRRHAGDRSWDELLADWRRLDEDLADLTATTTAEVDDDYPWLALADELSLRLCQGWTGSIERRGRTFEFGADELSIGPFPLAGATTFAVRARRIPDRGWSDDTSMSVALAGAPWESRPLRLVPLSVGEDRGAGLPSADPASRNATGSRS